jgi:hypothetical protein
MTASQNGWRVIGRDECVDVEVPGGELPIHPEFAWLAQDCAIRWHETVEPLLWPGCWGWAKPTESGRNPGRDGITNHASGTAWDLCAPKHPRGVPIGKTFTDPQLRAVEGLEARYFGVLRWGGRWTGKSVDGMHWEAAPGVSVEAVRELTRALAGGPPPAPIPIQPPPPAPTGWSGPDAHGNGLGFRATRGANGPRILQLQLFLRRRYPLYAKHLEADGFYGGDTAEVLYQFARRSKIAADDGNDIGPRIARALYLAGFR